MFLSGWVTSLFIYFTSVLASFPAGAEMCVDEQGYGYRTEKGHGGAVNAFV